MTTPSRPTPTRSSRCGWCSSSLRRAAAFLAFAAAPAAAQSVSPPIVEYTGRANGTIQLSNESIFPLVAVVDVRGFEVDSLGNLRDMPLDTTRVRVKVSQLSARLAARQSLTLFYDVTRADEQPAWFQIMTAFSGARTQNGIALRLELPHVVYIYQKAPLVREDVVVREFRLDPAAKRAVLTLENVSDRLARAQDVTVTADGAPTQRGPAFPFFPRSRRTVFVPWEADVPPAKVAVRFPGFTLETGPVDAPAGGPTPAIAQDSTDKPPAGAP